MAWLITNASKKLVAAPRSAGRQVARPRNTLTVGVDAVWTLLIGATLDNLRFRIFQPQGQPPSTQDHRAWRSLQSRSAVRAGPVVYRRRLSTPCVRISRFVRGPCGSRWAVVDGEAGLRRWPSLPQRCRRRAAGRVDRRSAAAGRPRRRVLLPSRCRRARSGRRPCAAPRNPRFQRNPARADQGSAHDNASDAPACTRSERQRWMRRCRRGP
jgi:hypothetical protein